MSEEKEPAEEEKSSPIAILFWIILLVAVVAILGIMGVNEQKKVTLLNSEDYKLFTACEDNLKENLKSPGSYKMVKKTVIAGGETQYVSIDYDAQNGYGALLRGNYWCTFEKDGILTNGRHRN